jgi:peptidoglycan/xylan/chitin deacetylase (PgdA/CDA1 family)
MYVMEKGRSWLRKMSFELGKNPKVPMDKDYEPSSYIPEPYKAVLVISADFELAWAWRYAKGFMNPYTEAIGHARTARHNIPKILKLCEEYRLPITWATVGHLFLYSCSKEGHWAHADIQRIPYHENEYWKYDRGDWFDDDPCTDLHTSPEWYAPDLVKLILESKIKHEIACHTFSHIDCRDTVCDPRILKHEVQFCRDSAAKYGIELKTFVHPGHTIGNLQTLHELGFRSYRTDYANILGYPQKHDSGLWELQSTMEFVYKKEWSLDYHVYRYKEIINRALSHERVCVFWFHPSISDYFVDHIMPHLFSYLNAKRKSIWVTTMEDYVAWLNRTH